ncbi:S-adenosyl-L-methionine-dependent methyltransferase [Trichophaea hybrida]|nr:S-adenosyl-L-methionine-dependent methyltransferase [Trichophaea hybrida]
MSDDDESGYEESGYEVDTDSMMEIEPDSDYDEVSSQYDSCYSSGSSVILSDPSARALLSKANLISRRGLNSDNTTTLFSEVTNYKWEHGRRFGTPPRNGPKGGKEGLTCSWCRYHAYAEGAYWGPNDDKQNQQLDIFHHIFTLILDGKLYLAPINEPRKVLDLGTGTGIWAIEMADKFPNTSILGNDLSPVQPTWIPANCTFEVDDFTRPWLYPPNSFDFIHSRGVYGCVADWNTYLTEAYSALAPGGWFESVEVSSIFRSDASPDGQLPDGSNAKQWGILAGIASDKVGRKLDVAGKVGGWMKKAGFVNIQEKQFKIPHGPWPKDEKMKMIGKINYINVLEGSEGFTLALFTRHLGWSIEKVHEFVATVLEEIKDHRQQLYAHMVVAYGQKPFTADGKAPMSDADSAYHSGYASAGLNPRTTSSAVPAAS